MTAILFPLGIRLSTWLAAAAFVALAAKRRDVRPLLAGWTWFWGYEALYDASTMVVGHPLPYGYPSPAWQTAIGVVTVVWMTQRQGIRPSRPIMIAVAALWVAWFATGFNSNLHTMVGFDALGEVFNEATKTLWALAYLLPLLLVRTQTEASTGPRPASERAAAFTRALS